MSETSRLGTTSACTRVFSSKTRVLLCLLFFCNFPASANDPEILQKHAIEQIEQYREHFYRTGERESLRPTLQQAEGELQASYDAFIAKGDSASAALSKIYLGKIENIRSVEQLSISATAHGMNMASAQPIETHNKAAMELFRAAFELAKKANHPGNEAKALMGLGRTDGLDLGNVTDGAADASEAIRVASQAGDEDDLFDALTLAAELELQRGRMAAASSYLDRAMGMQSRVKRRVLVYYAYMDRSNIYRNGVEVCTSEPRFASCYDALKHARGDLATAQELARTLGYFFLAQNAQRASGDLDLLEQLTKSQERLLNSNLQYFSPKVAKDVLVSEYFSPGASPETSQRIQQFLQQYSGATSAPDAQAYYLQGQMKEIEGKNEAALADYRKAIELLERDRRRLQDEESRGSFLQDKIEYYYAPLKLFLSRHQTAEAFELMEESRARAMADLLFSRPLDLGTPKERELFSELEQLRASIGAEQQKLFRFAVGAPEKHTAEIGQAQTAIKQMEAQEQLLRKRIAQEAPRLEKLTTSTATVSLEDAQKMAREGNYDVLYYLALNTGLFVWHIGADGVEVRNVFLPRSFLIDKVQKLRGSLAARAHDKTAQFDEQTSRELFLYLIQPMGKFIGTRHLVIVAHEDLNYISFQALQDPADGSYVGEKFQISYAPSLSVLSLLKDKPNIKSGRLLAIANPTITAAQEEVQRIGAIYPGRSKIVSSVPVNKSEVKAWASSYNLLHLSVHGHFDKSDPFLSYLELNDSSSEESHLSAAEMFGLPLPKGSMVVLSACETGEMIATHANELLGIQRALLYAGASELVLSSWEVEAGSTALWMETFYREAQNNSAGEAARLALLAVKARPEYRHPYFWSPFLLTGN
jgi:CHAT domain-containing protein